MNTLAHTDPHRLHVDAAIHTHEVISLLPSVPAGSQILIFLLSCLSLPHVLVSSRSAAGFKL